MQGGGGGKEIWNRRGVRSEETTVFRVKTSHQPIPGACGNGCFQVAENRHGPWGDRESLVGYLWAEIDDPSKAQELYPDMFASFQTKRRLMATKLMEREVRT